MASYQDLTASNVKDKSVDTSATKATMQADMDAALAKSNMMSIVTTYPKRKQKSISQKPSTMQVGEYLMRRKYLA